MWVNRQYEVIDELALLKEFVKENTLSTIITHAPVRVAHMPVEIVERADAAPKLLFHMPIVDPIAKVIADDRLVTVVVHGPQQYISPGLYLDPGLPTVNYGVAEVTDHCRQLGEPELGDHLHRLIQQREQLFAASTGRAPWSVDEIAQERFDRLFSMLVGFEVDLSQAQLKLKMGQNRADDDRRFTIDQLRATDGVNAKVTAHMETLL